MKEGLKVFLVVSAVCGVSAYLAFRKPTKPGHDLMSHEKPHALRNEVQDRDFGQLLRTLFHSFTTHTLTRNTLHLQRKSLPSTVSGRPKVVEGFGYIIL